MTLCAKKSVAGALLHSDQRIHYTNKSYQVFLKEKGIILSMSRKGNCWDNAIIENFFSHLKCECVRVRKRSLRSFLDVVEAVEEYVIYYNHEWTQRKLNGLSPVDLDSNWLEKWPIKGGDSVHYFKCTTNRPCDTE